MLDALKTLLAAREEVVEFEGLRLVVRELTAASDTAGLAVEGDATLRILVRCVYDGDGNLAFSDADLPAIKAASLVKLAPIVRAVRRVNGLDQAEEAKNSSGGPSSACF